MGIMEMIALIFCLHPLYLSLYIVIFKKVLNIP